MIKLTKPPLYRGLTRVFIVIAVLWAGLILFWARDDNFDVVRPDEKTLERVDKWLVEVVHLRESSNLPDNRRLLIQKALNTGTYFFNGSERKLTAAELKACRIILENGFSPQVKEAIVRASENAEEARSDTNDRRYRNLNTPVWDFRGWRGMSLEDLKGDVRGTVFWLNEIQTLEGMEKHVVFGMVKKYTPSGEFTGLMTEEDYALFFNLQKSQKNRWFLKPLFWMAAWLVPLLGMMVAGVVGVELVRWISRGFRNAGSARAG